MRLSIHLTSALLASLVAASCAGQDVSEVRDDQIERVKVFLLSAIQPSGLVRDALVLEPERQDFHPATPDAAGFALIGLSALDHVGKLPEAAEAVERILGAYAGHAAGITPDRSADGHFVHFMDIRDGTAACSWDCSYSPISTALLVTGAQFAARHFPGDARIGSLARELTASVNFNAAIDPSLNGGVFRDMTKQGGGDPASVCRPWNEYALVVSRALREPNNGRARAVKHFWLEVENLPKHDLRGIQTLTDVANEFRPAFLVQQSHFFNGDFRHNAAFELYFRNQQQADRQYWTGTEGVKPAIRYGVTAGVTPVGYHADAIARHPGDVVSPEAVAGWGDLETLRNYYAEQRSDADPRYRYGLVRVSRLDPNWVPSDVGVVDHLFLLFGLVESIDPDFFADRVDPPWKDDGGTPAEPPLPVVKTASQAAWPAVLGTINAVPIDDPAADPQRR
jgi:hypothetical protein